MEGASPGPIADYYRFVGASFSYAMFLLDPDFMVSWASESAVALIGYTAEEICTMDPIQLLHPDDVDRVVPLAMNTIGSAADLLSTPAASLPVELHVRARHRDGHWVAIAIAARLFDDEGRLMLMMRADPERQALDAVLRCLGRALPLDETLRAVVALVSSQVGGRPVALIHDAVGDLVTVGHRLPLDGGAVLDDARESDDQGITVREGHWVVPVRSVDGERLLGAFVVDSPRTMGPNPYDEEILGSSASLATLAFTRAEDDRLLRRAATHDHLTGVMSRRELETQLDGVTLDELPAVVLFLDLDGFKEVNDLHGHYAGDTVLVAVARGIEGVVRPDDCVARLGGDEFAVLCRQMEPRDAIELIERIASLVTEPIAVDGAAVSIGISIGMATARTAEEVSRMLRVADDDMYRRKRARS